jgi:hypothetical protein
VLFIGEIFVANFVGVAPIQAHVAQGPDGSHRVAFHPTVAGKYNVHVSLIKSDGGQIPGNLQSLVKKRWLPKGRVAIAKIV